MFIILASIYSGIFIISLVLIHFTSEKKVTEKYSDKKISIHIENANNLDTHKESNHELKVINGNNFSSEISQNDENSHIIQNGENSKVSQNDEKNKDEEIKLRLVFCSLQFYQIFFSTWILALSSYFIMANIKTLGFELGYNDSFFTIVGSVGSILNGVLRPLWGLALDKTSYKATLIILAIIQLLICSTFPFVMKFKVCFLIWYSILCSCIGGVNTQLVPISIKIFGPKTGIKVFSFLMIAITLCNISLCLIQYFVIKNVQDPEIYFSLAGFCGLVAGLGLFFREKEIQ